jgi:hypothetical protein
MGTNSSTSSARGFPTHSLQCTVRAWSPGWWHSCLSFSLFSPEEGTGVLENSNVSPETNATKSVPCDRFRPAQLLTVFLLSKIPSRAPKALQEERKAPLFPSIPGIPPPPAPTRYCFLTAVLQWALSPLDKRWSSAFLFPEIGK